MSRIFLTGDIHSDLGMFRLSSRNFPQGKCLSKNDYVIILGDFGVIWNGFRDHREERLTKWFDDKPFTTLFVGGNHENWDRLNQLETTEFMGGKVGVVSNSIFHLRNGEIYRLNGNTFFVFGGADSYDKQYRKEGISWWKNEIPSYADVENGLSNLEKTQFTVDYILAHTVPIRMLPAILQGAFGSGDRDAIDPTCKMLEEFVSRTAFREYYCGHWHEDRTFGKYNILYQQIKEL